MRCLRPWVAFEPLLEGGQRRRELVQAETRFGQEMEGQVGIVGVEPHPGHVRVMQCGESDPCSDPPGRARGMTDVRWREIAGSSPAITVWLGETDLAGAGTRPACPTGLEKLICLTFRARAPIWRLYIVSRMREAPPTCGAKSRAQ